MRLLLRIHKEFSAPGPRRWSGWDHDELIVNHYAPKIQRAMSRANDGIDQAIDFTLRAVRSLPLQKASTSAQDGRSRMIGQISAQAVSTSVTVNQAALNALIAQIYGDAYLIGTHAAANMTGQGAVSLLSALDKEIDWDNWVPGNPEGALRASGGGLARLLATRGIVIRGIQGSTLDRLGDIIAQGVEDGEAPKKIAQDLRQYVNNPKRSEMIARTETARAVTAASFETYREAGIAEWFWMDSPGACPICQTYAGAGPYPMGAGPYMPAHPNAVLAGSTFVPYGGLLEMVAAEYDGPAVRIRAMGKVTTIGPNHPLMTRRGLVRAKHLRKDDELLYDRRIETSEAGSLSDMHRKDVPIVEDAFQSALASSGYSGVATPAHDLHGDRVFCKPEVQVVLADSYLLPVWDSCGVEQLRKDHFVGANTDAEPLSGIGPLFESQERVMLSAAGSVSSGSTWGAHFKWLPLDQVRIVAFKGRAFDASTVASLYCSDGFVVSNCRCAAGPVVT